MHINNIELLVMLFEGKKMNEGYPAEREYFKKKELLKKIIQIC